MRHLAIGLAWALGAGCLGSGADFVPMPADDAEAAGVFDRVDQPTVAHEPANDAPAYPAGPYGTAVGDVAPPFSLPGDGPDDAWTAATLFAWGRRPGGPRVLAVALLSESCSCCMMEAPVLQGWHEAYGPDGLFVLGVGSGMARDHAEDFWVGWHEHDHPWAADPSYAMFPWSDPARTGMGASPSVTFVDLRDMRVVGLQMGAFSGGEASFEPLLGE